MKNTLYKRITLVVFSFIFTLFTLFSIFPNNRKNLVASADYSVPEDNSFGVEQFSFDYNEDLFLQALTVNMVGNGYVANDVASYKINNFLYGVYFDRFRSCFLGFPNLNASTYYLYIAPFNSSDYYFSLFVSSDSSAYINFETWGLYEITIPEAENFSIRVTFDNYTKYLPHNHTFGVFLLPKTYVDNNNSIFYSRFYYDYLQVKYSSDDSYQIGYDLGFDTGYNQGYDDGDRDGFNRGLQDSSNEAYNLGLDTGYNQGLTIGEEIGYDKGLSAGESSGYTNGFINGKIDGYSEGYEVGESVGYHSGYTEGSKASGGGYTFLNLMAAVVDAPIQAFTGLFNFEILGFNMSSFFTALLTACILMTVIKMLL